LSNVYEMNDVVISNVKVRLYTQDVLPEKSEPVIRDINKDMRSADDILDKAKKEAGLLLEKAKREGFEKGHLEGYERGYREGYEKGTQKGTEDAKKCINDEFSAVLREAHETVNGIDNEKRKILEETKGDILDLAFCMAEKILQYEMENNDNVMEGIFNKVIDQYIHDKSEKIYTGASNENIIKSFTDKKDEKDADIEFIKLNNMKKTDLFVQTGRGNINAGVQAQLKRMKALLADIRNR